MVRVTRNSKTSPRVAGCALSHYSLRPRSSPTIPRVTRSPISKSLVDRVKAIADARQSKKGAEVKVKVRRPRSCASRYGTISIPAAELLNELPVRVREEVEAVRNCCLANFPASPRHGDATHPRFAAANLYKHQLFSNDHAENLDPEIRQWLPRLVCPAFPLSSKCHGQGQRSDSMLRHVEICKHFQALFPGEYRRLFPRADDPRPPADDEYKLLKMTQGQLELMSAKLGKDRRGKRHTFVNMSPDAIRTVLESWRPLSMPGVEAVAPSDFPPVRMPQYFCAAGVGRAATEDGHGESSSGYEGDIDTGLSSSSSAPSPIRTPIFIADEAMRQDTPTLPPSSLPTPTPTPSPTPGPSYPELYLPPHLLPPTCDVAYLAAAIAAHAPEIDAFSPLLDVPITSLSAQLPHAAAASEYDLAYFSRAADHTPDFHHVFYPFHRLPLSSGFSQPAEAESGLFSSQVFFTPA